MFSELQKKFIPEIKCVYVVYVLGHDAKNIEKVLKPLTQGDITNNYNEYRQLLMK